MDSSSIFTPGSTNRAYDLPIFITPEATPTPGGATNTPGPSPTPTATPTVDYAVTTPDTPTTVPTVNTPTATPTGPTPTHTVTPSRTPTVTPTFEDTGTPTITPTSTITPTPTPYYTTTPVSCGEFDECMACWAPGEPAPAYGSGCYLQANFLIDSQPGYDLDVISIIEVPEGEEWLITGFSNYSHCYDWGGSYVNTCTSGFSLDLSINLDTYSPWDGIPPYLFTDKIPGSSLPSYDNYWNPNYPPFSHNFATPIALSNTAFTIDLDCTGCTESLAHMGVYDASSAECYDGGPACNPNSICGSRPSWYKWDAMVYTATGDVYGYAPPFTPLCLIGEGRRAVAAPTVTITPTATPSRTLTPTPTVTPVSPTSTPTSVPPTPTPIGACSSTILDNCSLETFTGTADDGTQDDIDGWIESSSYSTRRIEVVTTPAPYDGSYSTYIFKANNNGSSEPYIYQIIDATPESTYSLEFNYRDDGVQWFSLYVYILDIANSTTLHANDLIKPSVDTWSNYRVDFTMPSDGDGGVRIRLGSIDDYPPGAENDVRTWIDNIHVTNLGVATPMNTPTRIPTATQTPGTPTSTPTATPTKTLTPTPTPTLTPTTTPIPTIVACTSGLIANCSLETFTGTADDDIEDTVTSWTITNNEGTGTIIDIITTPEPSDSSHALYFYNPNAIGPALSQTIMATPEIVYQIEYNYQDDGTLSYGPGYAVYDVANEIYLVPYTYPTSSGVDSWTSTFFTFLLPADGTSGAKLYLRNKANMKAWLDNVELTVLGTPTVTPTP